MMRVELPALPAGSREDISLKSMQIMGYIMKDVNDILYESGENLSVKDYVSATIEAFHVYLEG